MRQTCALDLNPEIVILKFKGSYKVFTIFLLLIKTYSKQREEILMPI